MLSGKFVLRIDPKMHKALKEEAKKQGESLNSLCLRKISQASSSPHSAVLKAIVGEFNPLGVVLFGSAARGEDRSSSDIDLLIVLDNSTPVSRDLYMRWDAILKDGGKYSPQFVHLPSSGGDIGSLWLENSLEGEILYDRNHAIRDEFIKIRSQIAEGRYQRRISHGHAYWVRRDVHAK